MSAAQAITDIAIPREDSGKIVDCGDCSTHGHIIVKKYLKRENPDTSGTGGGADDHDSSSRLWGDAGVNAELRLAGISSLARGGRASKQFRV
jgi:hypothetical protein